MESLLHRNEYHLIIELLGAVDANGDRAVTDSLTVENYFTSDISAQVEKLIFEEDGTEWGGERICFGAPSGRCRQ